MKGGEYVFGHRFLKSGECGSWQDVQFFTIRFPAQFEMRLPWAPPTQSFFCLK
jgi:hypothetical protein